VYQYIAEHQRTDTTEPALRPLHDVHAAFRSMIAPRRPRRILLEAPLCAS
jgi:hypothetical protein